MDRTVHLLTYFFKGWLGYFLRRKPVWAVLYVTRKCNLSCRYCIYKDNARQDPPLEHIFHFLDGIRRTGCRIVSITGGEPALRADLPDIIAHCRRNGMVSYLNTNGHLLTGGMVRNLGRAGLDLVNISLDAIVPDEISKKNLQESRQALELLVQGRKRYGFVIISNQVITRGNISQIQPLLDDMLTKRIHITHGLKYPLPLEFSNLSDWRRLADAAALLARRKRQGYPIITTDHYLRHGTAFARRPELWKCLAGEAFFVVDLNGEVRGCDRLPASGRHISMLDQRGLAPVRQLIRRLKEFPDCSRTCMTNCAFETSFLCSRPPVFLAETVKAITARALRWITHGYGPHRPAEGRPHENTSDPSLP